jgi:hypothetical protein
MIEKLAEKTKVCIECGRPITGGAFCRRCDPLKEDIKLTKFGFSEPVETIIKEGKKE